MRSLSFHALVFVLLVACTHTAQKRERPDEPIEGDEETPVWATRPLEPTNAARLRAALHEAKTFAPALRPRYAATMLANAEHGRILRPLIDGLNLVQQTGIENAPLVLVQPFEKYAVAEAWKRSCGKGIKAIADVVVLPPEERALVLYATCRLDKSGLVTKEEARTADASALAMATIIHDRLKAAHAINDDEIEALRMLVIGSLEAFHDILPVADPDAGDGGIDPSDAPASEPDANERLDGSTKTAPKPSGPKPTNLPPPKASASASSAPAPKASASASATPAPKPAVSTSRAP